MERESLPETARFAAAATESTSVGGHTAASGALLAPSAFTGADFLFKCATKRDTVRGRALPASGREGDAPTYYRLRDRDGNLVRMSVQPEAWCVMPDEVFKGGLAFKLESVEAGTDVPLAQAGCDVVVAMKS